MLKKCLRCIDTLSEWTGRVASLCIYVVLGTLIFEIGSRFLFNRPTIWAHETSAFFFGAYFMLGAAYCERHKGMINVDIICGRFSRRTQAVLNIITFLFFLGVCFTLIYMGGQDALYSWKIWEHTNSTWEPPLYPLRTAIPVAGTLLLLQGLAKLARELVIALTGEALEEN